MKLFLLCRNPGPVIYDSNYAMVIRAKNEKEARKIANNYTTGMEGQIWGDIDKVACESIPVKGDPEVILVNSLKG